MSASRKRRIRTALLATAAAGALAAGSLVAANVAGAATVAADCPATTPVTSIFVYDEDRTRVHEDNDIVGVPDSYSSTGDHQKYRNLDGSSAQSGIRLSVQDVHTCRYDYAIFMIGGRTGQQHFSGIIDAVIGIRP